MTNSIDSVMMSAINSAYLALVDSQRGLVEESRSYVAEIRQAVISRLSPAAAAVIDTAIADETNNDPAAELLRHVVTVMGQEEEAAERVHNYLGGVRDLIESGRYPDAALALSSAVDLAGESALHAADVSQIRANILGTDNAHEDAQRSWSKIEANARISHTMMVVRDMLDPSLNDSPASSP